MDIKSLFFFSSFFPRIDYTILPDGSTSYFTQWAQPNLKKLSQSAHVGILYPNMLEKTYESRVNKCWVNSKGLSLQMPRTWDATVSSKISKYSFRSQEPEQINGKATFYKEAGSAWKSLLNRLRTYGDFKEFGRLICTWGGTLCKCSLCKFNLWGFMVLCCASFSFYCLCCFSFCAVLLIFWFSSSCLFFFCFFFHILEFWPAMCNLMYCSFTIFILLIYSYL